MRDVCFPCGASGVQGYPCAKVLGTLGGVYWMDGIMKKSVSLSVGRGEKLPTSKGAGLTAKGRAVYNAATGSNLKAPAPNPKTKADQGRKDSFCARMSNMPGPMKDEKGNPTRKAASLTRWKC